MPDDLEQPSQLSQRTVSLLKDIYLHSDVVQLQRIANNISKKAATLKCNTVLSTEQMWSEKDAVLITYPDNIMDHSLGPLESLKTFVEKYLIESTSLILILPFFSSSGADGFSVKNYFEVDQKFGSWEHIEAFTKKSTLMADDVLNHCSAKSEWFKKF